MARNVVKTRDYSFRGIKKEGVSYKVKASVILVVCLILTLQVTAQYIAYAFGHSPARITYTPSTAPYTGSAS
jgi:hypothetical protein